MLQEYKDCVEIDYPRLLKFTKGMSTSRLKDLVNQVIKTYLLRDKANKITMVRIFLTVLLIVLLLFPFYMVNIEFPKVLIGRYPWI